MTDEVDAEHEGISQRVGRLLEQERISKANADRRSSKFAEAGKRIQECIKLLRRSRRSVGFSDPGSSRYHLDRMEASERAKSSGIDRTTLRKQREMKEFEYWWPLADRSLPRRLVATWIRSAAPILAVVSLPAVRKVAPSDPIGKAFLELYLSILDNPQDTESREAVIDELMSLRRHMDPSQHRPEEAFMLIEKEIRRVEHTTDPQPCTPALPGQDGKVLRPASSAYLPTKGLLSANEIASITGLAYEPLRKALEYRRHSKGLEWFIEVENPKQGEPKFLANMADLALQEFIRHRMKRESSEGVPPSKSP